MESIEPLVGGKMLKPLLKKSLEKLGYQLQRIPPGHYRPHPIRPWEDNAEFKAWLAEVRYHTLLDQTACYMLYQYAKQAQHLSGEVAEIGVYRGGTARLLARCFATTGKELHLFDTFQGMPKVDHEKDLHREGDFKDTSLAAVTALFQSFSTQPHFYPGFFPATATPVENRTFCFVHIDVDIYGSVLDCCRFFYPRLAAGGIMVFDDYGSTFCPGAKAAVDEFFSDKPEHPCYLWTGQCAVAKLGGREHHSSGL
jgi:O-methyltransferase